MRINPTAATGHYNLGIALYDLKHHAEAAAEFVLYLKYAPNADDAAQVKDIIKKLSGRE